LGGLERCLSPPVGAHKSISVSLLGGRGGGAWCGKLFDVHRRAFE
jgi:hypothetical protein